MKRSILILSFLLWATQVISFAQTAINDNGAAANTHAILDIDISTNDKGILIPRLSSAQRTRIAGLGPDEEGLTVYDETTRSFWFWDGTQWVEIKNSGKDWSLSGNAGIIDGTDFIGTADNVPFNFRVNNQKAGRIGIPGDGSTFLGYQAGNNDDMSDNRNTFIGYQAGASNTTGYFNTAEGGYALYSNSTGHSNTASGFSALYSNTTASYNSAIGFKALYYNTTSRGQARK